MSLINAESLAAWTAGYWKCGVPEKIRGISTDTRTMLPGDLFVAIKGSNRDGHDFLRHAFERGASGAVVSREAEGSRLLHVSDTAEALRTIAFRYRKAVGAEVIAVTGSVGKTMVKELVADVLSLKAVTARTRGNWNNELGLSLSLLSMEESSRFGVFELGMNHPGELRPLCEMLAPDWGIVTTIGPVHLEFFNSVREIALEKSVLLSSLPREGTAILRKDQDWYSLLRSRAPCRIITVSMEGSADYTCTSLSGNAVRVSERSSSEFVDIRLPLPGRHIAENVLYAVAAGRAHGLAWKDIGGAVESYKTQSMRWERKEINGVHIINDAYNANPVNMDAALSTFGQIESEARKWLALGGMREVGAREREAHLELGAKIGKGNWAGLITVGALGRIIAEGAEAAGFDKNCIFRCPDPESAAEVLKRVTRRGDFVLLKASRSEKLEDVLVRWRKIQ